MYSKVIYNIHLTPWRHIKFQPPPPILSVIFCHKFHWPTLPHRRDVINEWPLLLDKEANYENQVTKWIIFFRYDKYKVHLDACSRNKSDTFNSEKKNSFPECCVHDPQLYYFYRKALNVSPSIEDLGDSVNGKLAGCLILAWILVYCCIVKGVKSSGKVSWF